MNSKIKDMKKDFKELKDVVVETNIKVDGIRLSSGRYGKVAISGDWSSVICSLDRPKSDGIIYSEHRPKIGITLTHRACSSRYWTHFASVDRIELRTNYDEWDTSGEIAESCALCSVHTLAIAYQEDQKEFVAQSRTDLRARTSKRADQRRKDSQASKIDEVNVDRVPDVVSWG